MFTILMNFYTLDLLILKLCFIWIKCYSKFTCNYHTICKYCKLA